MVTNAKQTLEQYNETREEGRSMLQPLFAEKNKKKEALKINLEGASKEEEETARNLYKSQNKKLNEKFKEKNKDLIDKYNFLSQGNKLNEKNFQEALKIAKGLNPEVDEEMFRESIMGKQESKEKMKNPQLEKENHKIDKNMSLEKKLKNGWKKEKNVPAYINGVEKKVTVLKKTVEGWEKDAFVWEYLDDGIMPKNMVGEQLFNRNAVLNLGLQTKLPSYKQMETIRGGKEKHREFLKNNFEKNGENLFPGYWDPDDKKFSSICLRVRCWLSDCNNNVNNVGIHEDSMNPNYTLPRFGFSLRLLKD